MASNLKISIDVLLNGTDQLKQLAAAIKQVANAGQGASRSAKGARDVASAAQQAQNAMIRQAQAAARLNTAQNSLAQSAQVLRAALTGTRAALSGISPAGASAALSLTSMSAAIAGIGVVTAGLVGVAASISAIGSAGIEANAGIEQLRIGIASILASVGEVRDAQGTLLKGSDALNAAIPISEDLLRRLRIAGLETALSFEELGQGLLQALGPGIAAGLNQNQILDLVISMSQLVGPLTGDVRQLGQEIRGLLSGNINRSTAVANALGISNEDVKNAREAGRLAEFLNEKLAVAAATGQLVGKTFAAATSNLREAGTLIATEVTSGLFKKLRDKINEFIPRVFDKTKANLISDNFKGIVDALTSLFDRLAQRVGDVFDLLVQSAEKLSRFLQENQADVDRLVDSIDNLFTSIVRLGDSIVNAFGIEGKSALQGLQKSINDNAIEIALLQDAAELMIAVFEGGIKAIEFAFLSLADGALRAVGIEIDGLTNKLNGLLGDLARIDERLAKGLSNVERTRNRIEAGEIFAGLSKEDKILVSNFLGEDFVIPGTIPTATSNKKKPGATATAGARSRRDSNDSASKSTLAALRTLGEAELALRQAFAQRAVDLARLEAEQENAILDRQLEDKQISLDAYYREKATLIEAAKKREVDAVNAEIALERDRLAEVDAIEASAQKAAKNTADRENARLKAAADRLRINAKIVDLETKLNQAEAKAAADAEENMRRRAKAARDLVDVLNEIPEAITRGVGAGFGQIFDETLRHLDSTRTRLDSELATSVQNIQNLVNLGLVGEIEARERILALEADKRKALEQNLQLVLETLRAELARPGVSSADRAGIQAQIAQTQLSLAQLKSLGVDPLFKSIRSGLENDLSGAFFQFLTAAEFGLDSIRDLAVGIVDSFRRAVAKLLLDQIEKAIIKPLTDKFLGFLGIDTASLGQTAQTVATNANTAALVTLTGAITGGAIAGQIGNGFALSLPDDLGDIAGQGGQNDPAAPLQGVFDRIGNSIKDFAKKIGGFVGNIGSGLKSIASAIVGFLSNLLGGLFGGGSNPAASPDLMAGFADGGLTPGAAGQVAGFVHGSEFVEPAHVVSRWGSGFFEALRTGAITPANISGYLSRLANFRPAMPRFGGFASGGLVGAVEPQTASQSGGRGVRIINVNDGTDVANFLDSAQGEQVILNRITRSPAKFRAALGVA